MTLINRHNLVLSKLLVLEIEDLNDELIHLRRRTRRRRRIWVKLWLTRKQTQGYYNNLMRELAVECVPDYKNLLRMTPAMFEEVSSDTG